MQLKKPIIIPIVGFFIFIALISIFFSNSLLFILTNCEEVEEVILEESVDVKGKVETKLTKKCVTEPVKPEPQAFADIQESRNELFTTSAKHGIFTLKIHELEGEIEALTLLVAEDPNAEPVLNHTIFVLNKTKGEHQTILGSLDLSKSKFTTSLAAASFDVVSVEDRVFVNNFISEINKPLILFDNDEYGWSDDVYVSITAPEKNTNPNIKDILGNKPDEMLSFSTEKNELIYLLEETGTNSGIFTGKISLVPNTELDINNDGLANDSSGVTKGRGPFDGEIAIENDDILTVKYEAPDVDISESVPIKMNIGEIEFSKASLNFLYDSQFFQMFEKLKLSVYDPDLVLDIPPWKRNTNVFVKVFSDSDPNGIFVELFKSRDKKGFFEAVISFATKSQPSRNYINSTLGDTVTAIYLDNTLPDEYASKYDIYGIITSATISDRPHYKP